MLAATFKTIVLIGLHFPEKTNTLRLDWFKSLQPRQNSPNGSEMPARSKGLGRISFTQEYKLQSLQCLQHCPRGRKDASIFLMVDQMVASRVCGHNERGCQSNRCQRRSAQTLGSGERELQKSRSFSIAAQCSCVFSVNKSFLGPAP